MAADTLSPTKISAGYSFWGVKEDWNLKLIIFATLGTGEWGYGQPPAIRPYLNPHLQFVNASKKTIRQTEREARDRPVDRTKAKAQTEVVEGSESTQLSLFNLIHIPEEP
jgi:hypothetical protein